MQGSEDARSLELIENLVRAKRELARELEANLKQLREVLKESERIARQLELVLQETQAPLESAPGARGGTAGGGGNAGGGPELTGTLGQLLAPVLRAGAGGANGDGASGGRGTARDTMQPPRRFWFSRPAGGGKGTAARDPKK